MHFHPRDIITDISTVVELVRNLVAQGDAREGSEGETGEWSG